MKRAVRVGAMVTLCWLGCSYEPRIRSGTVACQAPGDPCPAGLVCAEVEGSPQRLCVAPDEVVDAGAGVELGPGSPDGPARDAPSADAPLADRPVPGEPDAPTISPDATGALAPHDATPGVEAGLDLAPAFTCPTAPGPTMVAIEGRYCIDATEVTNQQYADFLRDGRRPPMAQLPSRCAGNNLSPDDDAGWTVPAGRARFPVNYVDWCDAYTYCLWAGKRLCGKIEGKELPAADVRDHRLSQWVRACSLGGDRDFPYGINYERARCDTGHPEDPPRLREVSSLVSCQGGYPGLFDMSGNVQEWVDACAGNDCYMAGGSYAARNDGQGEESHCQGSLYPERATNHWAASGFRCCSH